MDYLKAPDDVLCKAVKANDGQAIETLINRYADKVENAAKRYSFLGVDIEDLLQEGKIGVIKAAYSFNGDGVFSAFAMRCIKSAMITEIRRFTALKNRPLNGSVPLSAADGMEGGDNPETALLSSEEEKELFSKLKDSLSGAEYSVLKLYLQGYSRKEIAQKSGKDEKSVDNALQRIKDKLAK